MNTEVAKKDLWGMGYPYLIQFYANEVLAVSTDYGILLFKLQI